MRQKLLIATSILAGALLGSAAAVFAAGPQGQTHGSQMMTEQERMEHREQMRSANTVQEREQIRAEHHDQMQERAKAQGKTLPDTPPVNGAGVGGGMGHGGGHGKQGR